MINSLVTILIPCNNSVNGLKTTIESLLLQTKIKGTKVFVLDYESKDGSIQYADQASSEYTKTLSIECIDMSKNSEKFQINTPYCFWVLPGTEFKDTDFLFDSFNHSSAFSKNLVFYKQKYKIPFLNSLFYYLSGGKGFEFFAVLLSKENIWDVKNETSEHGTKFHVDLASYKKVCKSP